MTTTVNVNMLVYDKGEDKSKFKSSSSDNWIPDEELEPL